ncbi:Right handed beta helix region [Candidatus Gugararchaeum adminiculabundum]|nr:Right handed beta helix region [Candidatus Gugararchaeum adminiculabundum]
MRCDNDPALCNLTSYSGGTLVAQVSGFSNYSTEETDMVNLRCGHTITTNATMSFNLYCNESGAIIGADGITLDCNHHTLTGEQNGSGVNSTGWNNITLKNCIISNFTNGIWLESSSNDSLLNNFVYDNTQYGVYIGPLSQDNNATNITSCYNPSKDIYNDDSGDSNEFANSTCDTSTNMVCDDSCPFITYCGDSIGASSTMETDLLDCPGNGLLITEDNVVLNCNGHTISTNDYVSDIYGIVATNRQNIIVKNCVIKYFTGGVYFVGTNNTLIQNNTVYGRVGVTDTNASTGIFTGHGSLYPHFVNNTVDGNTIDDVTNGIFMFNLDAPSPQHENETIENNNITVYDGGGGFLGPVSIGIFTGVVNLSILNNTVVTRGSVAIGIWTIGGDAMGEGQDHIVIANNTVNGSIVPSLAGIVVQGLLGGRIENNTVLNMSSPQIGAGIVLANAVNGTIVYGNTIVGVSYAGIVLNDMFGWTPAKYGNNTYNTVIQNNITYAGIGILVQNNSVNNTFQYNSIIDSINLSFVDNNTYAESWMYANVSATYNYWGTSDANEIRSKIYDYANDTALGNVTYIPYLTRPYSPYDVACGTNITMSTTLAGDAIDCPGNGLNISASNIVLDCNGHTLSGSKIGYGIYMPTKANNTIKNCVILNFSRGIYLQTSLNITLESNSVYNNTQYGIYLASTNTSTLLGNSVNNNSLYGIYLSASNNNTLSNNHAYNNTQYGIVLSTSSDGRLTNNTAYDNGITGMRLQSSSRSQIENNTLYLNGIGGNRAAIVLTSTSSNNALRGNIIYNQSFAGIWIDARSANITVTNNTIFNSSTASAIFFNTYSSGNIADNLVISTAVGIDIVLSDNFTISNNTLRNNSYAGMRFRSSSNNSIVNNTLAGNARGIYLDRYSAYYLSSNNTIADNNISTGNYGTASVNSRNNTFSNNSLMGNLINGIYDVNSNNTYILNNLTLNGGTTGTNAGVYLSGSRAVLANNTLYNSSAYGIQALLNSTPMIGNNTFCYNRLIDIYLTDSPPRESGGALDATNTFCSVQANHVIKREWSVRVQAINSTGGNVSGATFYSYRSNGTKSDGARLTDVNGLTPKVAYVESTEFLNPYAIFYDSPHTFNLSKSGVGWNLTTRSIGQSYDWPRQIVLVMSGHPELKPLSMNITTPPLLGTPSTINALIANTGGSTASDTNISIYLDGAFANSTAVNISAGTNATVSINYTFTQIRIYNVTLVVDANNSFDELNELDNNISRSMNVIGSDFSIVNFSVERAAKTECDNVTLNVSIKNSGVANGTVLVSLYHTEVDPGNLIGSQVSSNLSGALFHDVFNQVDGVPVLWTNVGGTWLVSSGVLRQSLASGNRIVYANGVSSYLENYTYEARMKRVTGNGVGLVYRRANSTHYYYTYISYAAATGYKVNLAKYAPANKALGTSLNFSLASDWFTEKVVVVGNVSYIYINNRLVMTYNDTTNPIPYGGIGLFTTASTADFNYAKLLPFPENSETLAFNWTHETGTCGSESKPLFAVLSNATPSEYDESNNQASDSKNFGRMLNITPAGVHIAVSSYTSGMSRSYNMNDSSGWANASNVALAYNDLIGLLSSCVSFTPPSVENIGYGRSTPFGIFVDTGCAPDGTSFGTISGQGFDYDGHQVMDTSDSMTFEKDVGTALAVGDIDFGIVYDNENATFGINVSNVDETNANVSALTLTFSNLTSGSGIINSTNLSYFVGALPILAQENGTVETNLSVLWNQPPGSYSGNATFAFLFDDEFATTVTFDLPVLVEVRDSTDPVISSLSALPSPQSAGDSVTIAAVVSDNILVSQVIAEVTYPGGIAVNYSLSNSTATDWSVDFPDTTAFGDYAVTLYALDSSDNLDTAQTSFSSVDGTPPVWDETPANQTIYSASSFYYDLNATDNSGLVEYFTNDSGNFTMDMVTGFLTNSTSLGPGIYQITVTANDSSNNPNTVQINLTVIDTTPPEWVETPVNQIAALGLQFSYDLNATDNSGTVEYFVNDTGNFTMDINNGVLTNATFLDEGIYQITVTANDSSNNPNNVQINITVLSSSSPNVEPRHDLPNFLKISVPEEVCVNFPFEVVVRDKHRTVTSADVSLFYNGKTTEMSTTTGASGSALLTASRTGEYRILATYPLLRADVAIISSVDCSNNPIPKCTSDSACADDEKCLVGGCTKIEGVCGYAAGHAWTGYKCCSDSECASDSICASHSCTKISGTCGHAENHVWVPYECCADGDCASGEKCTSNACAAIIIDEKKKDETKKEIDNVKKELDEAKKQGKPVEEAANLLAQADAAYANGDYNKASELAQRATYLMDNAPLPPPPIPPKSQGIWELIHTLPGAITVSILVVLLFLPVFLILLLLKRKKQKLEMAEKPGKIE